MVAANKQTKLIPWRKAWVYIFLSVLLINGTAFLGIGYFKYTKALQRHDITYNIVALVQTSSHGELLKSGHLPELLGLSVDKPQNLFEFDTKEAKERLEETVAIKKAVVKRIRPGTIHVDLTMRDPIAFVGNFSNTAFDEDGIAFPLKPFYTPKNIPNVFFEDSIFESEEGNQVWGTSVLKGRGELATKLLTKAPKVLGSMTKILTIDVSKADAPSFGQRQIVMTVEETDERVVNSRPIMVVAKRTLRFSPDNWEYQLANYIALRNHLNKEAAKSITSNEKAVVRIPSTIIDLRLRNLAFIGQ